ncbi:uncharacterized protein STEHIDRAFT_110609 [Stereum hirsutum FP-91666 SS1]|uniref:uncharacterized protein n=1 Tax=Stereum hirsutum (strain FP-91666) TaxID=721885 RepID=UPI000440D7B9|nr:uncharacterized protein STEHIDRAFT_110609 [Stereum hirsutum FP-91666 SS1]EIM87385.1 hypothetical protein STEHIDRAFT_110609 [Stereum hirsutum FP-91666 SS1]
MSSIAVRQVVAPSDVERNRMVEIMTLALANDSSILCLTGGSKEGERVLLSQWVDAALELGEVWVAEIDQRIEGVALWIKPGKDYTVSYQDRYLRAFPPDTQEWTVQHFRPKYEQLYKQSYPLRELTRLHAWHLKQIAVNPRLQRRGIGRALIAAVRDRAPDVPSAGASQGFAYRGVKNFVGRRGGFPLWAMLREPRKILMPPTLTGTTHVEGFSSQGFLRQKQANFKVQRFNRDLLILTQVVMRHIDSAPTSPPMTTVTGMRMMRYHALYSPQRLRIEEREVQT